MESGSAIDSGAKASKAFKSVLVKFAETPVPRNPVSTSASRPCQGSGKRNVAASGDRRNLVNVTVFSGYLVARDTIFLKNY